jgi:hypothetical protein
MKSGRLLLAALLSLLILILLDGCASGKYVPRPKEELYGTWTNDTIHPSKIVIKSDGTFQYYDFIPGTNKWYGGTFTIYKRWKDSEGNILYETYETFADGDKFQRLWKISKSGKAVEMTWNMASMDFSPIFFPANIDPTSSSYCIFYSE